MSVYFEYLVDSAGSSRGTVLCSAWSNGDVPILASSTSSGCIELLLEEGSCALDALSSSGSTSPTAGSNKVLQRSGQALHLAWHPKSNFLASGWDDGTIGIWHEKDKAVVREEGSTVHKASITALTFSPDGSRLLSADSSGLMVVWNFDHRGRLHQLCSYHKKSNASITHICFRAPPTAVLQQGLAAEASVQSCPSFFFATANGVIYHADDLSHCSEVLNVASPLNAIYYSHTHQYLVLVTVDVVLHKYRINDKGAMSLDRKVKLSIKGNGSDLQLRFVGNGLLVGSNHESLLRVWSLEREDSYILTLQDPKHNPVNKDVITCLDFNPIKRVLVGGTGAGRVVFWRYIGREGVDPSSEDWEIMPPVESHHANTGYGVNALKWCTANQHAQGLLSITSRDNISILNETVLHTNFLPNANVGLIQLSTESLSLQCVDGKSLRIDTNIRIKGFDMNSKHLLIWNGKKAEVRELPKDLSNFSNVQDLKVISSFATKAIAAVIHNDTIYAAVGSRIEILNLQGIVKNSLAFTELDGNPVYFHLFCDWLVCSTSHGVLKLYDLSRREPKSIVPARAFQAELGAYSFKNIKINHTGSKISFISNRLCEGGVQLPDSRLHVYDVESDKLLSHDFGPRYYPVLQYWDLTDSKLLAVETKKFEIQTKEDNGSTKKENDKRAANEKEPEKKDLKDDDDDDESRGVDSSIASAEVTTLFVTSDYGILMQDSFGVDPQLDTLVSIHVPHLIFLSRPHSHDVDGSDSILPRLRARPMRDFVGLEQVSEEARKDLMSFSYYLTVGNMDEAYRAVKKINSESIWSNMAQAAVRTKRLDVAEVCLGNMANARGAKAVRESKKEPEKEAQIAMLAIQLNLLDDAERLYKECGRYDLLVHLYMASGRWKDAIKLCSRHDRIHLKSTHYQYARHLESIGDTVNAIKNYEKSETHRHEVPRMLYDTQHINELEQYIKASDDTQLMKWWAQYCESNGAYEEAIKYYDAAKETLALVRVYCYRGEDEKAAQICIERGDSAASYHLARQYESQEKIKEAIHFYKLAKRYNHGIRLAKEHYLENDLMQLALECNSKELKIDAAQYFESKQSWDKSVLLYQQGGKIPKALELCFRGQLFDSLRTISDNLGSDTDPALLSKCADFFLNHGQFEKAAHLFIIAKQYMKALTLCMKQNVKITEQMAEKMTPAKAKTDDEKKQRDDILKKLAHCCKDQGSYHLACKKYTQAGDHVRAMKCLLKSSDTEKIVYYATMTKQPDIYILAANYLQNLDWHNDPEIMKTIINFYTKAKAMQQLAVFYDACAQVEIDEYRDYEKALGALQDSLKFMIKGAKSIPDKDEKMSSLDARIRLVQRFVEARKLVKTNPDEMIRICNSILDAPDVESAIRVGDVYALLIEYYHSIGNFQQAYQIIERMRASNIILSPYLDQGMVQAIHAAVGVHMQAEQGAQQQHMDDHDIGEEINEDIN